MTIKLNQAFQKYQTPAVDPSSSPSSFSVDNPLLPPDPKPQSLTAPGLKKNPYISHPHQLRALQLAQKFNDESHKIHYLNLCKSVHPTIIDQAESFVTDANANNKAALFMWKVKQIKLEWQQNQKDWHNPEKPVTKSTRSAKRQKKTPQPDLFS